MVETLAQQLASPSGAAPSDQDTTFPEGYGIASRHTCDTTTQQHEGPTMKYGLTLADLVTQGTKLVEQGHGEAIVMISNSRSGVVDEANGHIRVDTVKGTENAGTIIDMEPGTKIVRISVG